jgi:topoisomerase IV subunit A
MKAQGNQLTKLKVKEVVLSHSIEGDEPWPEPEKKVETKATNSDSTDDEDDSSDDDSTMEWDMCNDDDQPKLF